jgi:hypothetical protein
MSDIQLTADFSDIQTMNRELLETSKNARSSARVFEAEFNRVERLLNKTAKTNQQYFNSVLGVGTATKSASDSAEVFNKSLNRQAAEVDRLAKKFNPLYRASKQYESAVEEIDKAHKMGAISLSQHEAALEQLNAEYARFNSGVAPAANSLYQFGQQTRFAGKSANRFGMRVQQVGYQVGDFLVQVQSGTSWLVAFGQQGTQLAGLLPGVAGAVIGIGLALSTAIGGVIMRQYINRTNDLSDALKQLAGESKNAADEAERLARGLDSVAQLRVQTEIERVQREVDRLQALANAAEADPEAYGVAQERLRVEKEKLANLQAKLNTSKELGQEERNRMARSDRSKASLDAMVAAMAKQVEQQRNLNMAIEANERQQMRMFRDAEQSASDLAEAVFEAYKNGDDLSKLSVKVGIDAAAIAATELARQMGISLGLALDIVAMGRQGFSGPDAAREQVQDTYLGSSGLRRDQAEVILFPSRGQTSREGSVGGGSPKVDPLEQLRQRIKLETELLGKTEAQKEMIRALGVDQSKYTQDQLANVESMIEALIREQEQREKIVNLQETLANSATDLFFAAAKSTDAFKASLASMLQTLAQAIAQQAFLNALQNTSGGAGVTGVLGSISKILGFADGGVFNRGNVMAFAGGGVVSQPNFFPMAGGKTGLMGEAGPEAIMPLKRGKDGKLGVATEGGGGTTVIQPQINIDARGAQQGVAEQINASITQALPTIIEATVSATKERSRRGAM